MNISNDTIAAISTPSSPAAIGMVRLSGENALKIADTVFKSVSGKKICDQKGYTALFGRVFDKDGEFDEAVALVFRAPKSYTGQDVVEITVHGGIYLTRRLLRTVLTNGARLAQAGEFTRRAFENGKLSLLKAEAVSSLISAKGQQQAKAALAVCDGRLNTEIKEIYSLTAALLGRISAYCDYPDEDIVDVSRETLEKDITEISNRLEKLINGFDIGRKISNGIDTAIVGSPNVGKSTIMNMLAGCERSIVTDIAGTTRDVIEDTVDIGGITLKLSDTAGIRETADSVEAVGVERAKKRMDSASLMLAVFDASRKLDGDDLKLIENAKNKNAVAIINKTDLESRLDTSLITASFENTVFISAKSGQGRDELIKAVKKALEMYNLESDALLLLNERQYDCSMRAKTELDDALNAVRQGQFADIVGITLGQVLEILSELTGEKPTEAVVNEIFSKFCVGK